MEKSSEAYNKELFFGLYNAKTEVDVDAVIVNHPEVFGDENWFPLGGDEKMFGIVRNQQSSPIAALVEKVTNSIDAILMRKCFESGVDPKSPHAPMTMEEAIQKFFPDH